MRVAVVFDTPYSGWDHREVFDKRRTQPEERIATQFAKWDESYRERTGIRNVVARPVARYEPA